MESEKSSEQSVLEDVTIHPMLHTLQRLHLFIAKSITVGCQRSLCLEKTLSTPVDIVGTDHLSAIILGHEPLLFETSVPSEAVTAVSTSPYASSTAALLELPQ
jgi:hypothetical protein